MYSDVAIIIPSRIGSTRLPRKALAKIGDKSLIQHVVNCLKQEFANSLYVATDSEEIVSVVKKSGAKAILTDESCPTGSDRIHQAFNKIENKDRIKYIINVQGDMPFIDKQVVIDIINVLKNTDSDIATASTKISLDEAKQDSNVKLVMDNNNKALYFSRSMIPHGASEFLYHVGIYGFRPSSLDKFVNLEISKHEGLEKLEQLRALDNGMSIGVSMCNEIPISVDTKEDLDKANKHYSNK